MGLWLGELPLVLASQSQSRQVLLRNAGIAYDAKPADIDERDIQRRSGLVDPAAIAGLLAAAKAKYVALQSPGRIVIGTDQTLALGSQLFSKPDGRDQAAKQLGQLAGGTHELHSAVAVVCDDAVLFEHVSVARMTMRPLTSAQISAYLDHAGADVTTSVGAYQLEKLGVHLFSQVEGDHFTVLGLPLLPLLDFLRGHGLLAI